VDWLDIVVTPRAGAKIRHRLRELGELEPVDRGKPKVETVRRPPPVKPQVRVVDNATREKLIRVEGKKGMAVQFARCCNPMPGHVIVGYATRNPGIMIHRVDCRTFARTAHNPQRRIEVSWEGETVIQASLRATAVARSSMLADITAAISRLNITIAEAQFLTGENAQRYFDFVFTAPDRGTVDRVIGMLRNVAGVSDVTTRYIRQVSRAGAV
jgi:(p)ppGpp synthase/HD superfamily hydrolase